MKELNDWQRFLNTGSVEDYLVYKHLSMDAKSVDGKETLEQKVSNVGDSPYAGIGDSNRDCIKNTAYRGI